MNFLPTWKDFKIYLCFLRCCLLTFAAQTLCGTRNIYFPPPYLTRNCKTKKTRNSHAGCVCMHVSGWVAEADSLFPLPKPQPPPPHTGSNSPLAYPTPPTFPPMANSPFYKTLKTYLLPFTAEMTGWSTNSLYTSSPAHRLIWQMPHRQPWSQPKSPGEGWNGGREGGEAFHGGNGVLCAVPCIGGKLKGD